VCTAPGKHVHWSIGAWQSRGCATCRPGSCSAFPASVKRPAGSCPIAYGRWVLGLLPRLINAQVKARRSAAVAMRSDGGPVKEEDLQVVTEIPWPGEIKAVAERAYSVERDRSRALYRPHFWRCLLPTALIHLRRDRPCLRTSLLMSLRGSRRCPETMEMLSVRRRSLNRHETPSAPQSHNEHPMVMHGGTSYHARGSYRPPRTTAECWPCHQRLADRQTMAFPEQLLYRWHLRRGYRGIGARLGCGEGRHCVQALNPSVQTDRGVESGPALYRGKQARSDPVSADELVLTTLT